MQQKTTALIALLILPLIATCQEMWINEIHYDNSGGDVNEFVEVVLEDTFTGSLADIEVVFYNGSASSGNVYNTNNIKTLDTFDVGQSQGGFTIYSKLTPSIQNGSPDGMALINNGQVVEFISYEGSFTAAGGPAIGLTSVDIGVSESSGTQETESLQLSGSGSNAASFNWQAPATATRGLVNNGQTLQDEAPKIAEVSPTDGTLSVGLMTPIIVTFSESVNVVPASFNVVCDAINQGFSIAGGSGPTVFTLVPDAPWPTSSLCTVTLVAANITDLGMSNQQLDGNGDGTPGDDFSFSFNIASDALVTVASVTPADQAVLVPENFTIDVNFSENVDLTVNAISIDCQGNIAIASGLPATDVNTVTITPASSVAQGTECTVTLVADQITDKDGNMDFLDGDENGIAGGDFQFTFTIIEPVSEIYDIQGAGLLSPLENTFVRLQSNIVTAVSSSGFFMQTPDARDDSNVDTSNGIFVFTGEEDSVTVGDMVDLRAFVVEFFEFTELTSVSNLVVTASNQALPNVIEFDENTPSQDSMNPSCAIEFECYEGMLIRVQNGLANSGSQAFNGDDNAEAIVTATGQRALREPGVELSFINEPNLFDDPDYMPDIFDENPEIFELDVDALGLPPLEITGGSTFSATGVLAYQFNDYELWPFEITLEQKPIETVTAPESSELTIATQNMFRFFDDVDDPDVDDFQEDSTTTETFNARVAQASLYIQQLMKNPDIIIMTEIENLNAAQAIANKLAMDNSDLQYAAHLVEGNDFGGIDIGILTKQTVSNITITQLGADETLQFGGTNARLHDRPPLQINATVTLGSLVQEVNVLGVHLRSRSGITGSDRERIRNKHFEQSLSVAQMVQNIQSASPDVPLAVIGDFNDFEFSDGYADMVGEISGIVEPEKNLLSSDGMTIVNPVNPTLTNAVNTLDSQDRYSFIFRGIVQALDHVLINDAALTLLSETSYIRGNVDAPRKFADDFTQPFAMSDHDGLMIKLELLDDGDLVFRNGFD